MSKDRVARVRELVGSMASMTIDEVAEVVAAEEPELYGDVAFRAIRNQIRSDLTADAGDGLPWAMSVDNHGTYRQRSFFDADEYRFAIRQYMKRSEANKSKAYRLADECQAVHGVEIDPEEEARAS